jgi:hypothetical protein
VTERELQLLNATRTFQDAIELLVDQPDRQKELKQLLDRYNSEMEGKKEKQVIETFFAEKLRDWIYWSVEKYKIYSDIEDFLSFKNRNDARAFLVLERLLSSRVLAEPLPAWVNILHTLTSVLAPAIKNQEDHEKASMQKDIFRNLEQLRKDKALNHRVGNISKKKPQPGSLYM